MPIVQDASYMIILIYLFVQCDSISYAQVKGFLYLLEQMQQAQGSQPINQGSSDAYSLTSLPGLPGITTGNGKHVTFMPFEVLSTI